VFDIDLPKEIVKIRPSTWTNQEQDFWLTDKNKGITTFSLWNDHTNPIHKLQWRLTDLAIREVNSPEYNTSHKKTSSWKAARKLLDAALASDQYWWASAKPWWSLEMIESGAFELKKVVITLDKSSESTRKAHDLYRSILDKAFEWQRTGYIREMHLKNSGTYMKEPFKKRTPVEWHNQVVLEFEYEMNSALKNQDFEKAVKWRDALRKIKLGSDIYDILHVVDELWLGRNVAWAQPKVKPFLEHDWNEFSDFAVEHFRNISNEEDFEKCLGIRAENADEDYSKLDPESHLL